MFKIEFETDNAAFEDMQTEEVARILREIADKVENGSFSFACGVVRDYNGNTVGKWLLDNEE